MTLKWKTIVALIIVYCAVIFGWYWVWGLLFIMWTLPALYSGQTHLVEPINRSENPVLFWLIIATWIGLSVYMIAYDLVPMLGG